ncbi:MAG: prenyltransferase [Anaerolineaceae bacterium]|nr:prenyltransferase [Anaerolineaceae bacterium]
MKYIIRSARPQFLILAPICVFAGLAASLVSGAPFNGIHALLAFIGGTLAHASVNLLNEYEDFKTGLDNLTIKTPFSGGTGNLQENPDQAQKVRTAGWIAAGLTLLIGIFIALQSGWGIIPIGILGLLIIFIYTSFLNKFPWLCIISPGLGFGPLMVMGSEYAISGQYTWTGFLISLVPFFLVNNLLLLNQFPDLEPDQSIGRKHFPIAYGRKNSAIVYTVFLACTYLVLIIGTAVQLFSWGALFGLATVFIAIPALKIIFSSLDDMQKLGPAQGMNVLINLLTPLLAGIGMLLIK